jgi:hypothetical protein
MTEENTKKLMELGKDFIHPDPELQKNLMAFGFECGDGWFNLLYQLIEDIKKTNPPEGFEIFQVKEKFGGLRFYTDGSTYEIENLIETAENKSVTICERCGADAETKKIKGWYTTICEDCEKISR